MIGKNCTHWRDALPLSLMNCRTALPLNIVLLPLVWALSHVVACAAGGAEPAATGQPVTTAEAAETPEVRSARVEFNRDIRPILSDRCYACHGPDSGSREAGLRLDLREAAVARREGTVAIVPGQPEQSLLMERVLATDAHERMPPEDSGKSLTAAEIDTLRRWIRQGAEYQPHWSFIRPQRPPLPAASQASWVRNPIDAFVLARLRKENLQPAVRANRTTLIRRASLDLTGLPPALEEVDAFLADTAPGAFGRMVDRLLASPRYGERMAVLWLDAARYADTNGYFTDQPRAMWPWRDWVIDAYNSNMPFDRFTIEQLAGDLLDQPDTRQLIATGFNRNHMVNDETGIVDEEYRVEYVVDRLSTTSTVWLGLTVGCARCHDHKFDPISQREFYQLFAFFNNGPETGLAGGRGNAAPVIGIADTAWQQQRDALQQQAQEARARLAAIEPELNRAQLEWEQNVSTEVPAALAEGLAAHYCLEDNGRDASGRGFHATPIGSPEYSNGVNGNSLTLDGDSLLEVAGDLPFERDRPFSCGGWMKLTTGRPACLFSKNDESQSLRGLTITTRKGHIVVRLAHHWSTSAVAVETRQPAARHRWQHVLVTWDGSGTAAGIVIYLDGRPVPVEIKADSLNGSIHTSQPFRIGRSSSSAPFIGSLDDVRIYNRQLKPEEARLLAESQFLASVLAASPEERSAQVREQLRALFLSRQDRRNWQTLIEQAEAAARRAAEFAGSAPTTMVMRDLPEPRKTFLLKRGEYDRPGEQVSAGVPASLPPLPADVPRNRLGLARWLVDPAHPLTARVAVNRLWQMVFGAGIVRTPADFGSQGELPEHPELLDWLAVELIESGWDVKHMLRLMVTSATWQQSSRFPPELVARDPENRLLARGPRFRMSAEMLRDNALAVSGLLVERLGGPSVKPWQPPGLWKAVVYDGALEYVPDTGASLYRRGLYSYWKRQSPPPAMLAFDAPVREACVVQRSRTSTPLQALVLMNDPVFVEAARKLAERTLRETGDSDTRRKAIHAFRLATARFPSARESRILVQVFEQQLAGFRREPARAKQLLSVGEAPVHLEGRTVELAAWATVANMILSLDETLNRE